MNEHANKRWEIVGCLLTKKHETNDHRKILQKGSENRSSKSDIIV